MPGFSLFRRRRKTSASPKNSKRRKKGGKHFPKLARKRDNAALRIDRRVLRLLDERGSFDNFRRTDWGKVRMALRKSESRGPVLELLINFVIQRTGKARKLVFPKDCPADIKAEILKERKNFPSKKVKKRLKGN